jgi:acylphosphatase
VGFVRNEPDGTVLVEAQGTSTDLEAFLSELRLGLSRFIRGEDAATIAARHGESAFEIA